MILKALTQCQHPKNDGQQQPNFMDNRVQKKATGGRENREQYRGYDAMDKAQSSNAEAKPVPSPFVPRVCHSASLTAIRCTLQHYIAKFAVRIAVFATSDACDWR